MANILDRKKYRLILGIWIGTIATACTPVAPAFMNITPPAPRPAVNSTELELSGISDVHMNLKFAPGPAVLHITVGLGSRPFKTSLSSGTDKSEIINSDGPLDEYRGYVFASSGQAVLDVESDRPWKIDLLAPDPQYFPILHVPGKYSARTSAVILLKGKYGIAIFSAQNLKALNAWAYSPGDVGEQLSFKTEGDYRGRAVLPKNVGWIIVSAAGPWSVEVQTPCCEVSTGDE